MFSTNIHRLTREGLGLMMRQDDAKKCLSFLIFYLSKIQFDHDKCISEILAVA